MQNVMLHKFWWIGLPLFGVVAQIVFEFFASSEMKNILLKEGGPHETAQALVMAVSFLLATILMVKVKGLWLKLWFGLAALASFYIAGEEVSWGQWIFHWDTPEHWATLNDQNETNLHNISDWLDQKPQALLQIGILVGGIIIPLMQKFSPARLPQKLSAIYGDSQLLPTALVALGLKITDTICDAFDIKLFWRGSEVLELYMFYFVFVYLLYMLKKQKVLSFCDSNR